ncbi:hypothetical protein ADN00_18215 [Ornatilinea apprima]|uniref:NADP-dependent oxidoreductase domain-containing protein n=1 Tax=Ornatilinea apprima TaxID=1134406 RepID=A0A0N8GKL1_9CHLR|nr:hypothetical protein ADN00_18215 [Ornatilinea apprima]
MKMVLEKGLKNMITITLDLLETEKIDLISVHWFDHALETNQAPITSKVCGCKCTLKGAGILCFDSFPT